MTQKTKFILLGLLKSGGPLSGYALKKEIGESTANFWNESFGAIYPALHKLEDDGLVSSQEEGAGKRKLIQYSITEKGEETLRKWLSEPAERQKPRHELLLKLFFSEGSPVAQTREHIQTRLLETRQRLKALEQLACDMEREYPKAPALPYWMMTIKHGILHMRATIEWCQQCLETMEEL